MRFQILGSSSSGNCSLIETEHTRILLDAGFSGRKIEALLQSVGRSIEQIDAVFLTHEHGDHSAGMRGLSRYSHLKFYATYPTAQVLQATLRREVQWRIFEPESTFTHEDLTVEAFRLPHDAHEPVGFVFRNGGSDLFNPSSSLAWLTDLGYVPDGLPARVKNVDVLVVEANHDLELLENDTKRPFSVKQRIRGRHGHLSNHAARDFLQSCASPFWRRVYLVHISRDCNCLQKVASMFGGDQFPWPIEIVDPDSGPLPMFDLIQR
jgi:phosphoribosyl 1,2-cyclic phosphodiesterase